MGEPPKQGFLSDMLNDTPLKSKMIRLTLPDIKPYEKNPRWTENPKFDEIKESIKARGLDHRLVVTLRPGERQYVLKKGGGTRYKILNELWQETGDRKYFDLEVVFEPYTNERDIYSSHGVENFQRGNMSFIEAAKYYIDYKEMLEDEEGCELSFREACDQMNLEGHSMDPGRLTRYTYALQLFNFIPLTLMAGTGRTTVDNIRRHEKTSRDVWLQNNGDPNLFEQLWGEVLAKHDHDDHELPFDLDGVQADFENIAGPILGMPPQHLSALVDMALHQPDDIAMSDLTSGPLRPAHSNIQNPSSTLVSEVQENLEQDDPETKSPPLVEPSEKPKPKASHSTPSDTPSQIETDSSQQINQVASTMPLQTLLPSHIESDSGPTGGFNFLFDQVEKDLSEWVSPRDNDPLFIAAKPVITWANLLLSYFNVPSVPEKGDSPGQLVYVSLTDKQLHLRAPDRYLTGDHVFDHVWLRIAYSFYGPVLLERDQPSLNELTGMIDWCTQVLIDTEAGQKVLPEQQIQRLAYLHALSHLIFSDPIHHWLEKALQALQSAALNYQIVRRSHADPNINPLGALTSEH